MSRVVVQSIVQSVFWFVVLFVLAPHVAVQAQLRIKAVGDVLLGSYTPGRFIPPDSGRVFVRSVGEYLRGADIVFGNFEASFAKEGWKPQKCAESSRRKGVCFEFGVPVFLAPVLKELGFTVMSLDNNHVDDYGAQGAEFTKTVFREQSLPFAAKKGTATLSVQGKTLAVVAFGFSETSWNVAQPEEAAQIVQDLKKRFPLVIVSFHGGAEGKNATHVPNKTEMFYGENRGNLVKFAHAVVDAGADLVLGHGPHVLRAVELYQGKLIAYSLGNFLTYGNINVKGVSGVTCVLEAEIELSTGRFQRGKIIPVQQDDPGIPRYDASKQAITLIQQLTREDFPNTPLLIDENGIIVPANIPAKQTK